jgi:hypothetical protein
LHHTLRRFWHLKGMYTRTFAPTQPEFRIPSEPTPPPIKEPIDPLENPDVPIREPDPQEPGEI